MRTRPLLVCASPSKARPAYAAANAGDRLQLMVEENTPHRVNPEAIQAGIAWFVRWLGPSTQLVEESTPLASRGNGFALRRELAGLRVHGEHHDITAFIVTHDQPLVGGVEGEVARHLAA